MKNKNEKIKGLVLLSDVGLERLYGKSELDEINESVNIYAPPMGQAALSTDYGVLNDADVIFSGWGCPLINDEFLDAAPNLKAVFYAAGTVKHFTDKGQIFDRGIKLTSSAIANAVPVAEFCLSQILFSLKLGWHFALSIKENKAWPSSTERFKVPGCYKSTVGIISLGMISKKLIELLRPFDLNILVSSNHLSEQQAAALGVRKASIEEIFCESDVVSLHSPDSSKGIITGEHFKMMKHRSTFINTARGICVREAEMLAALKDRKDVIALLDVTEPEPPVPGSEMFDMPNVVTFPHIAGSLDGECKRLTRLAIDDFYRFRAGNPLQNEVTKQDWMYLA